MHSRIALLLPLLFAATGFSQVKDSISLPDSIWNSADTVTWVRKVPNYCEGPAYEAATGAVYFTVQTASQPNWPIYRVVPGVDTGGVWYNTKQNNGLAFDPQGRLVACENGQVVRLKANGTSGVLDTVLTGGLATSVQTNDLTIGKQGDIYFTGYSDNNVYYINTAGQRSTVATGVSSSNGIEWLRDFDSSGVYVNATGSNAVYRYVRDPVTGALSNRTTFISGITQPDGGTFDSHGNHYVASYGNGEVRVYNAAGTYLGRIALRKQSGIYDSVASQGRTGKQGNSDNCVFGGSDMKTLYLTGDGGLFALRLQIAGVPASGGTTAIYSRAARFFDASQTSIEGRDAEGRLLSSKTLKRTPLRVFSAKPEKKVP